MLMFPINGLVLILFLHSTTAMLFLPIKRPEPKHGAECEPYSWYKYDVCMPNGEIHHYRCEEDRNYDGTWARKKDKDQLCSGQKSKCLCEKEVWDEFDNNLCRCVDSTPKPSFPPTGILKWKEIVAFKKGEYYSWVHGVQTEHEIHRNADGHYLRKYADYKWSSEHLPWEYKFEIYVPIKSGKYKKITGTMQQKICQVEIVDHGGSSFDTLWFDKELHHLNKKVKKSKTKTFQVWYRFFNKDHAISYKILWKMYYNSKKQFAIPFSQVYNWEDDYYERYRRIRRRFKYTEVSDSKVSFDVKDYCKNEV